MAGLKIEETFKNMPCLYTKEITLELGMAIHTWIMVQSTAKTSTPKNLVEKLSKEGQQGTQARSKMINQVINSKFVVSDWL